MDIGYFLSRSAHRSPGAPAVVGGGRTLTYRELDRRVTRLANALLGLGLSPGDRVIDLQHNSVEYLETDLAMARAGLVRVAVNSRLPLDDWSHITQDCGARGMVYGPGFTLAAEQLIGETPDLAVVLAVGDGPGARYEEVLTGASDRPPERRPAPDELVSLNYSSGTTGRPKGCMRTHRNRFASARDIIVDLMEAPLDASDMWLHAGPLTHASGLFVFPHVIAGATQVLMPHFDPDLVLELIGRHRVTGTVWVPTMIERVIASPGVATAELTSLRRVAYAGAPMAAERIRAAHEALGGRLAQFYGMVEAIPPLTVLTQADHAAAVAGERPERLGSAGRAVLGCELAVVGDDGDPVGLGEVGELVVSGDHPMAGYWGSDDETGKTLRDGRLWTGDLATIDDGGYVTIVDRRSDMIISGGYNVYPREVEDVIAELDEVAEVAVVGAPDVEWGQVVTAFVVPQPLRTLDADEILAYCQNRLPGFKKPRRVRFVDELPKGPTGKISRKLVRQHAFDDPVPGR